MKLLVVLAIIGAAYADFHTFNQRYPIESREQDGPYQPSGWRPSGPPFSLPARQQLPRQDFAFSLPARQQLPRQEFSPPPQTYGPPPTYGPPAQEYGPPEATTTEAQEITTTELPTTTENVVEEAEQLNDSQKENEVKENEKLTEENSAVSEQGIYYIYHPSGLLQRVIYMTKDDVPNMAYSAQLKYENVEPIREPIYTYDPKTLIFRQLQI
ncbi:hypothetical protein Zmor_001132 [Zophobas morio]|uniref:DUF4794 domain-containing protein n=1 Tax=Zophobas morio TaxID=2755281 RepID=A0AA38J2Q4_9CUCU|nr:hypothetical protein Zmor_001132 [Zophobas morio]